MTTASPDSASLPSARTLDVAGGQKRVSIQSADFDLSSESAALRNGDGGVGAVVSFVGTVRDRSDGSDVAEMELEHYPGMTERSIEARIDAAMGRFDVRSVVVIHRIGRLRARDQIVLVAVASAHRGSAFAACEYLMDYLKTEAPFWKKEYTPAGARWVDARSSDDSALKRWTQQTGDLESRPSDEPCSAMDVRPGRADEGER